jgi:molybdenum cofactor cytidylyltransferase
MTKRTQSGLAGIVLAAGSSERLGEPKQLLVWNEKAFVAGAVEKLLPVCGAGVVVVTGANADKVAKAVDEYALQIVTNPDWRKGMSSSLRCGIEALGQTLPAAALIMLCDQPLISDDDIDRLVSCWLHDQNLPVATRYNDAKGVPAILPASSFAELMSLTGDSGARQLVAQLPDEQLVSMDRAGFDIDTVADLAALKQITQDGNTG